MKYDVIIIGAGPGGIFAAYELVQQNPNLSVAVFEAGHALEKRHCPIDGDKVKSCIGCKSCSIMSGFGGAGAFSDGKLSLSPDVGGNTPNKPNVDINKPGSDTTVDEQTALKNLMIDLLTRIFSDLRGWFKS